LKKLFAGLCVFLCVIAGTLSEGASAADPMFDLILGEQWSELDRLAHERLAEDPLDGAAIHALARLSIDAEVGTDSLRDQAMAKIRACLAARPQDGLCRLSYGQVFGVLIKSQSMFEAMGSVGKITAAFEAAVAADPASYDARESLVTFYIRAPGIVGGSMKKAYAQTDSYAQINPDYARLLYALIALEEDDLPKAEAQLAKLPDASDDSVLTHMVAKRYLALGLAYLDAKDYTHARAALVRSVAHGATSVAGYSHWGLGRIAQAEGRPGEAVDEFHAFLAFEEPTSKPAEEARASLRQLGTN
jgi:tetratricopeptide (TPR) repeat protein